MKWGWDAGSDLWRWTRPEPAGLTCTKATVTTMMMACQHRGRNDQVKAAGLGSTGGTNTIIPVKTAEAPLEQTGPGNSGGSFKTLSEPTCRRRQDSAVYFPLP